VSARKTKHGAQRVAPVSQVRTGDLVLTDLGWFEVREIAFANHKATTVYLVFLVEGTMASVRYEGTALVTVRHRSAVEGEADEEYIVRDYSCGVCESEWSQAADDGEILTCPKCDSPVKGSEPHPMRRLADDHGDDEHRGSHE